MGPFGRIVISASFLFNSALFAIKLSILGSFITVTTPLFCANTAIPIKLNKQVKTNFMKVLKKKNADFLLQKSAFCMCITNYIPAPWQFLYFLPLPQGHGSFLPITTSLRIGC